MSVSYEPWLVLLSVVIAAQGAYVGLSLAVQVATAVSVRRRLLLAGSAFLTPPRPGGVRGRDVTVRFPLRPGRT